MSKDTQFVHGTIVEDTFLNEGQEVDTGLIWGFRLDQQSANSVETGVVGDPVDTQTTAIVGGRRVWKNAASTAAVASGLAGARDIYLSTTDALAPDYDIEVLVAGNTPSAAYFRQIGSATWDGVSVLDNIKLSHGVQAESEQYNQFTFRSITGSTNDVALTIEGYSTQETSEVFNVGHDDSGFQKRLAIRGDGRVAWTAEASTDYVADAAQVGDVLSRLAITAEGKLEWGDGALARDVFVERLSDGVLQVNDGTAGGEGTLDLVYLQNSETGGASNNGAGMVNVLDDLNLALGQVYRIDGVQFDSSMLADASDVAHLSGTETFTGAKTFSQTITSSVAGAAALSATNGWVALERPLGTNHAFHVKVNGDVESRMRFRADGQIAWSDGTALDVTLERSAANILRIGAGDRFEQAYMADVSEPDVLVNRATMDAAFASGAASKAFSYFIS